MLVKGEFQAKKLTKRVGSNGAVYRKLWIVDEYDNALEVSIDDMVLPKLKRNGVYLGYFEYEQRNRYEGYGVDEKVTLFDVEEIKKDWNVSGTWDI